MNYLGVFDSVFSLVITVFFLLSILQFIVSRLSFAEEKAQIEQLRSAIENLEVDVSREIISQVAGINKKIASAKLYRKFWWPRIYIAPGWDNVDPIIISQQ